MDIFWMVFVDGKQSPIRKHYTQEDAEKEAERLAKLQRGSKVHILQTVRSCIVEEVKWETIGCQKNSVILSGKKRSNMEDTFESQIFGITRNATDKERIVIINAVKNTPVSVFQELNKALNNLGLCIQLARKARHI